MAFDKKEYMKEYRKKNKERIKEYRKKNKEKIKEYEKEYHKKNREKKLEYKKKRSEKRKELGLCTICAKPKHKRLCLCLEHHRYHRKQNNEYRNRYPDRIKAASAKKRKLYKETGRCSCGRTLNPDMDNGRVRCLNCREGMYTPRRQHGNIIF